MRRLAIAFFGIVSMAATAKAADIPPPVIAPAPVVYNWTGFYLGGNLGYGWARTSGNGISSDLDGVIGGGQIGYNWQWNPLVLGIEADIQASGQKDSGSTTLGGVLFTGEQKIPWFGTVRGRVGYAFGPWMIYATGGVAWVNLQLDVSARGGTVSDETTKTAWTVGGGVEWLFLPRWSAKLEYLFIDTGSTSVTLLGRTFDAQAENHIVRVGVNYHF